MTLREYIELYYDYYPERLTYIGVDGLEYLHKDFNAFVCECGNHCVNYGSHKFNKVCVKCAISEYTADLVWDWIYNKKGYDCFSKENFKKDCFPIGIEKYGNPRLAILIKIFESAYRVLSNLCGNFKYRYQWEYELSLELGDEHPNYAKRYTEQEHIKTIESNMKHLPYTYYQVLNKLSSELELNRKDIPINLVSTQSNIINLNRLIRQRKKQCQTNQ